MLQFVTKDYGCTDTAVIAIKRLSHILFCTLVDFRQTLRLVFGYKRINDFI